jgi:Radical SAM superfamily
LQCPYCSNPVDLEWASAELSTKEWKNLIGQMPGLGILQIHFSGGEPMVRKDLVQLIGSASDAGLYVNLITSGVLLNRENITALAGVFASGQKVGLAALPFAGTVTVGSAIGTAIGLRWMSELAIRWVLALILLAGAAQMLMRAFFARPKTNY